MQKAEQNLASSTVDLVCRAVNQHLLSIYFVVLHDGVLNV